MLLLTAGAAASSSGSGSSTSWTHPVLEFVRSHYLPLALISALLLGATFPSLGVAAAGLQIPALTTFGIFVVQVCSSGSSSQFCRS